MNFLKEREGLFLALADATRLRILNLLSSGEVCVAYFTEVLGESQPKVSRHLAYLRGADLVSTRRDGKWIFYSINWPEDEGVSRILTATLRELESHPKLVGEKSLLSRLMEIEDLKLTKGRKKTTRSRASRRLQEESRKVDENVSGFDTEKVEDLDTFLL